MIVSGVLLMAYTLAVVNADQQSVAVEGFLFCHDVPAANVKVKLYDVDTLRDDLITEGTTDQNGYFRLSGTAWDVGVIDPKLNIYHNCDNTKECMRKLKFYVPESFVYDGPTPGNIYNFGTIQLALMYGGESRDCINKRSLANIARRNDFVTK